MNIKSWFKRIFKSKQKGIVNTTKDIPVPHNPVVLPTLTYEPPMKNIYTEFYEKAMNELGVRETSGKDNPKIIQYHATTTLKAIEQEVSWCSSFACWVVEQCGIESTNSAAARSWLKWGKKLDQPVKGCIVVFSRGNNPAQGHVAFYHHEDKDFIYTIGGNQNDSVMIKGYQKSRLLEYRGVK